MIRDAQVVETALNAGFDHLTQRVMTIAPGCMSMQNATQIALLYQFRERMPLCRFDLPHILAQLRLNIIQTKRGVDIGLIFTRDQLALSILSLEESVVINGHIHAQRTASQGNMVLARTREMMQGIRKLAITNHTQVHGYARTQDNARFGTAFSGNGLNGWLFCEEIHDRIPYIVACIIVNTD